MDNKEIKTNMTELNDETLENVSGGAVTKNEYYRPSIPRDTYAHPICAACGCECSVLKDLLNSHLINGEFYCDSCKEKLGYK